MFSPKVNKWKLPGQTLSENFWQPVCKTPASTNFPLTFWNILFLATLEPLSHYESILAFDCESSPSLIIILTKIDGPGCWIGSGNCQIPQHPGHPGWSTDCDSSEGHPPWWSGGLRQYCYVGATIPGLDQLLLVPICINCPFQNPSDFDIFVYFWCHGQEEQRSGLNCQAQRRIASTAPLHAAPASPVPLTSVVASVRRQEWSSSSPNWCQLRWVGPLLPTAVPPQLNAWGTLAKWLRRGVLGRTQGRPLQVLGNPPVEHSLIERLQFEMLPSARVKTHERSVPHAQSDAPRLGPQNWSWDQNNK